MVSTNAVFLAGLVGAGATAFAQANQPYVEPTQMTAQPAPAATCTLRLNRFYADDKAPLDERYIGTPQQGLVTRDGPYADRLFPSASLSGITYSQPAPIENMKQIFWPPKQTMGPTQIEVSFLSKGSQTGRLQPNGKHDTLYSSSNSNYGLLVDDPNVNWSESFEVKVNDPEKCLVTRKALVGHPPDYTNGIMNIFSSIATYSSDSYARTVWENVTGKPSDPDKLKADPDVRVIGRDARLQEDRASGQLKQPSEYRDIPPPYATAP